MSIGNNNSDDTEEFKQDVETSTVSIVSVEEFSYDDPFTGQRSYKIKLR